MEYDYTVSKDTLDTPSNVNFYLHTHEKYEVYMFIEGDAHYVVEDKIYSLEPLDVIIVRKHEMHRVFHNSDKKYTRLVMMLSPDFFSHRGCAEYEQVFLEQKSDKGNKVSRSIVISSGLYNAFMRLEQYSKKFSDIYSPVCESIMVEILYIINNIVSFSGADVSNKHIKQIISYVNENFTEEIRLDTLAQKFYISKYHMCRIFKEATGLTIQKYIRQKRLMYARELIQNGTNKTEAALLAGFNNYSSFYRYSN